VCCVAVYIMRDHDGVRVIFVTPSCPPRVLVDSLLVSMCILSLPRGISCTCTTVVCGVPGCRAADPGESQNPE
jgi:hypothetical protein